MRYCPHCRKPTVKTEGECPHCGSDLDGEAADSADRSGGYSALSGEDEASDESIELETVIPATPAPYLYDASMSPAPDALADGEVPLEGVAGTPVPTPVPTPVRSFGGAPVLPALSDDEDEPIDFSPEDLEELAQYGPPPSGLVDLVKYSFHARRRSAELHQEAERLAASLDQAKAALVAELAKLGERARVASYETKLTAPLLAEVAAAERDAESAADASIAERRRHREAMAQIEAELEALRKRMEEPRLTESKIAGRLAEYEQKRRQIEGHIRRIEIEIRNNEQIVGRAECPDVEPGQSSPPPVSDEVKAAADAACARLPGLHKQLESARTQNSHLDEPIADLRGRLAIVRTNLDKLKKERAAILERRDEEERQHAAFNANASDQAKQAQEVARLKLAEIGRALRLERDIPDWGTEMFPIIDQKALAFHRVRVQRQLHQQAAEAFDKGAVTRGTVVLFGGAGLVALGAIALIALILLLT